MLLDCHLAATLNKFYDLSKGERGGENLLSGFYETSHMKITDKNRNLRLIDFYSPTECRKMIRKLCQMKRKLLQFRVAQMNANDFKSTERKTVALQLQESAIQFSAIVRE